MPRRLALWSKQQRESCSGLFSVGSKPDIASPSKSQAMLRKFLVGEGGTFGRCGHAVQTPSLPIFSWASKSQHPSYVVVTFVST